MQVSHAVCRYVISMRILSGFDTDTKMINLAFTNSLSQLGKGPGPVVHTGFPNSYKYFPTIELNPHSATTPFLPMQSYHSDKSSSSSSPSAITLGRILPIVDTVEWIERLVSTPGITDVQLRFKDTSDYATILDRIQRAQALCKSNGVRLWINDHWNAAIKAGGCFGVHLAGGFGLLRRCRWT